MVELSELREWEFSSCLLHNLPLSLWAGT